jgi:hypothetical protein
MPALPWACHMNQRARHVTACDRPAPLQLLRPLHRELRPANHPPRPAGATLKVSGFKSERRPASPRNAVRLQIGIGVRLRRNLDPGRVTKAGAGFKVLDNPSLDTTCAHGKLLLSVLGAIAEFERSMIRSRCAEGIVRAKANGIAFGRKPKLSKFQIDEAKARLARGETTRDIARTFGVSHSTISRLG